MSVIRAGLPVEWNTSALQRFFLKVHFNVESGCWLWRGSKVSSGYGEFKPDGRRGSRKTSPHRFAYAYFRGDNLEGKELDHICAVYLCCNPWHLEVVTHSVNIQRGYKRRRPVERNLMPMVTETSKTIDWRARFVTLTARQKQVREERTCSHSEFTLVRVVYKGGREAARHLCHGCNALFGNLRGRSSVPQFDSLPFIDKEKYEEQRRAQWQSHYQEEQEEYRRSFNELYNSYLNSLEWGGRRALVLRRAQDVCEGCLRRPAVMVHHLTYAHVGDELLFELRAICATCHEKCHED